MILDLFLLEGSSYSSASVIYVYLLKTDGICKIYLRLTSTLNFATDCSSIRDSCNKFLVSF